MNKSLVKPVILILALSLASGLVYNLLSDNGITLLYQPAEIEPGTHLTSEQTYRLLREGLVLFIDSRYEEEYQTAHIPGAINIPANLAREAMMNRVSPIPKDKMIVIYCSSVSCQSARRLAGFMTYLGYEKISVYLAGFEEWLRLSYPVEKKARESTGGN